MVELPADEVALEACKLRVKYMSIFQDIGNIRVDPLPIGVMLLLHGLFTVGDATGDIRSDIGESLPKVGTMKDAGKAGGGLGGLQLKYFPAH